MHPLPLLVQQKIVGMGQRRPIGDREAFKGASKTKLFFFTSPRVAPYITQHTLHDWHCVLWIWMMALGHECVGHSMHLLYFIQHFFLVEVTFLPVQIQLYRLHLYQRFPNQTAVYRESLPHCERYRLFCHVATANAARAAQRDKNIRT